MWSWIRLKSGYWQPVFYWDRTRILSIYGKDDSIMRTVRQLSEETKLKISVSLRGKVKTEQHKKAISRALKDYWQTIPDATDIRENKNR